MCPQSISLCGGPRKGVNLPRKGSPNPNTQAIISNAFGAQNRTRLLNQWFTGREAPTPESAWKHVYRLLLWIDRTTGLAHCYESDKSQPGKRWYSRSLAFHEWVSGALGTTPSGLAEEIDWLFKRAIEDLTSVVERDRARLIQAAHTQRAAFEGRGFPEPGEDPELVAILEGLLAEYFSEIPPAEVWRTVIERIRNHWGQENKRKNLVGEGFEDVLAAIVSRLPAAEKLSVFNRRALHDLPGFNRPPPNQKPRKVDLAVVNNETRLRTLVTAKWSVRADREEQFDTDFRAYEHLEAMGESFEYVLITNEFDAARLLAASDKRLGNRRLFSHVVHVNLAGVLAAHGESPQASARDVVERIGEGRLTSLSGWLSAIS